MLEVQLPTKFQPHPEQATGIITLDQAAMMIRSGDLSHEGARFLLPPRAWELLPKPAPQTDKVKQRQRWRWIHRFRNWRQQ
jgi:hypothetical protein